MSNSVLYDNLTKWVYKYNFSMLSNINCNNIISDIEQGFMPWLMDRVTEHLEKSQLGRLVLDGLLREVISKRSDMYSRLEATSTPHAPVGRHSAAGGDKLSDSAASGGLQTTAPVTTMEVSLK